jgi:hypothetical protein
MGETSGVDDTVGIGAPAAPSAPARPRRMRRRVVTVAVGLGAAAGVAVGATALAGAATAPTQAAAAGTTTTTTPGSHHGFGGRFRNGPGGFFEGPGGIGGGFGGAVVHGQYTVKGPNGYETIDERTGTVSTVTDTSGSTWTLTVKSADGTSGTFTVNSSSSVNGGESGIASVKVGDTVSVTATVSGTTATATEIVDRTTLQANGKSWMPLRPQPAPGTAPATSPPGAGSPPSNA